MIAKLNKGTGFGGLVNYANDIKQKDTNIIASDGVSLTDKKTIATSFKLQACGNPKVKKYVGHAMLSFSPKDKPLLTDAYVERIAKDYLQRMGIVNTQYVIFRHHDQPHDHVHIVYNRVDNNGNEITTDTNFHKSAAITQALTREYGLTFGRGKTNVRRDRLKGKDAVKYRVYDIANNLLHHNEYVSLKEFAKDLAEHGITLTGRKNDKGKTVGIIFTMDGMSFAGSKIDKDLSFANVMQLIDSYSRLYPERARFWDAKDNCPENVRPFIVHTSDGNTKVKYFQEPQPFQSDMFHFIDNSEMASNNNSIVSNIADAAMEVILQPTIAPTPSVGGGSSNKRDDDDEEKRKNKNHPTKRTGWRR